MGLFDFLKGGKTEEKAPPKEAPAKPKEKPHAPERTAESLQAEQMRLLRGTAILNGERLKTLRPEPDHRGSPPDRQSPRTCGF